MKMRTLIIIAIVVGAIGVFGFFGEFKVSGTVSGPSIQVSNLVIGRSYRVDDDFVERLGEDIDARFSLILPQRRGDTHQIGARELPPGGIVQFNFRTEEGDFMESLYVAPVDIPEAPIADRLAYAAQQLTEQAPRVLANSFDAVTVTGEPREIEIKDLRAMELTGTYKLREDGSDYAWRFVILPHPDRVSSLYTVGHVNLALHPVATPDDHAGTLTGKALSTLKLTDLVEAD